MALLRGYLFLISFLCTGVAIFFAWRGDRAGGIVFGIAATVICVFSMWMLSLDAPQVKEHVSQGVVLTFLLIDVGLIAWSFIHCRNDDI